MCYNTIIYVYVAIVFVYVPSTKNLIVGIMHMRNTSEHQCIIFIYYKLFITGEFGIVYKSHLSKECGKEVVAIKTLKGLLIQSKL